MNKPIIGEQDSLKKKESWGIFYIDYMVEAMYPTEKEGTFG